MTCNTCGDTGRWETTFEDAPTTLVDIGPCPDCVKPRCNCCSDEPVVADGLCRMCWIDQNVGTSPPPVAGVDYEPSGCPICGGTDDPKNHESCLAQLDVWPEPGYGEE